jgi:hypothetical protein
MRFLRRSEKKRLYDITCIDDTACTILYAHVMLHTHYIHMTRYTEKPFFFWLYVDLQNSCRCCADDTHVADICQNCQKYFLRTRPFCRLRPWNANPPSSMLLHLMTWYWANKYICMSMLLKHVSASSIKTYTNQVPAECGVTACSSRTDLKSVINKHPENRKYTDSR